ncbi:MAG: VCBS domain-containing protein, partial [Rhodocyclales bacterium]|nr:VCBS domain-containing protein [Rhodocyclales bacterium]
MKSIRKNKPSNALARLRMLRLEPRLLFDGAAAAEVVAVQDNDAAVLLDQSAQTEASHTDTSSQVIDATHLLQIAAQQTELPTEVTEAQQQAAKLLTEFMQQPDALTKLFNIFNGGQGEPSADWLQSAEALRQSILGGEYGVKVEFVDGTTLHSALAAFAAQGVDGAPTIYLNAGWMAASPDVELLTRSLLEELGHSLDAALNPVTDTAGDEGQLFAGLIMGDDVTVAGYATDNDHEQIVLDGQTIDVERANLSFINAYAVNVSVTPAGKEQSVITFFPTSLGVASITDGLTSGTFSGNDVPAVSLNINGVNYYGWISRPIKENGVVKGLYFWTDVDFVDMTTAQNDGNADADGNVSDNSGFILVLDQAWFNTLINAGTYTVNSSSDRVDTVLNDILESNHTPDAVNDSGIAVEAGGVSNGTLGSNATGSVLSNDTDVDALDVIKVTKIGTTSPTLDVSASTTSANGKVVTGVYGTLTIGSDGTYSYVVDNSNAAVQALRTTANTLNDTFTYTITDSHNATDTANLVITIRGKNDNPIASNDYNTAKEYLASNLSGTGSNATGNVLNNDTDVDSIAYGETLVVTGASGSAVVNTVTSTSSLWSLAVTGNNLNKVTAGDELWYVYKNVGQTEYYGGLFDAQGNRIYVGAYSSATGSFSLSGAPAFYRTDAGTSVSITSLNALALGFMDISKLSSASSSGTDWFSQNGNNNSLNKGTGGALTGSGSLSQLTFSSFSGTVAANMAVLLNGSATGATIQSVNYDTNGSLVSVTLSQTISVTSGETLTFSGAAGSTMTGYHGTLVLNADGSYTYTPKTDDATLNSGQTATEAFQYKTQDLSGATSTATLYINVMGSSASDPNAVADTATAVEAGGTLNGTAGTNPSAIAPGLLSNDAPSVTTPSTETLSVIAARAIGSSTATTVSTGTTVAGLYGTLTVSSTGAYTYSVDNSNSVVQALRTSTNTLTDTFVYTIKNSVAQLTDTSTLTVTINGANDAPVAIADTAIAIEKSGVANDIAGYNPSGNVLTNDTDVDDAASELVVTGIYSDNTSTTGTVGNYL